MEDLRKCFLGEWKTRNGSKAIVTEQGDNTFYGVIKIVNEREVCINTINSSWNAEGNSILGYDYDLIERKLPGEGL